MSQYYVKKRSMHSFIDWVTYAHDRAVLHYSGAVEVLNCSNLSDDDKKSLMNERDRATKYLREYDEFIGELNNVELLVLKHIVKYNNRIKGMSQDRYSKIKMDIYFKWCRKFMPFDLVYVHEIDSLKLALELKRGREEASFSRKSVAGFLVISESSMKMYEIGERTPKLNVLYALCELYGVDLNQVIKNSLK